jgi:hypothetical protein
MLRRLGSIKTQFLVNFKQLFFGHVFEVTKCRTVLFLGGSATFLTSINATSQHRYR